MKDKKSFHNNENSISINNNNNINNTTIDSSTITSAENTIEANKQPPYSNLNYIVLQQRKDLEFFGCYFWINRLRHSTKCQITKSLNIRISQEEQLKQQINLEEILKNPQSEVNQKYEDECYNKLVDDPYSYNFFKYENFDPSQLRIGFSSENVVNYDTPAVQFAKFQNVKKIFSDKQFQSEYRLLYHYVFYVRVLINMPNQLHLCQTFNKSKVFGFFCCEFYYFDGKKYLVNDTRMLVMDFLRGLIIDQKDGVEKDVYNFVQVQSVHCGYQLGEILLVLSGNQGENKNMKIRAKYIFQRDLIVEMLNLCKQTIESRQLGDKILNPNIQGRDQILIRQQKLKDQGYRDRMLHLIESDNIIPPKAILTAQVKYSIQKDKHTIEYIDAFCTLGNNNILIHQLNNKNCEPIFHSIIPFNHDYFAFEEQESSTQLIFNVSSEKIYIQFTSEKACKFFKQAIKLILNDELEMNQICINLPTKPKVDLLNKFVNIQYKKIGSQIRQFSEYSCLLDQQKFLEDCLYYDEQEKKYSLQDEYIYPSQFRIDINDYINYKLQKEQYNLQINGSMGFYYEGNSFNSFQRTSNNESISYHEDNSCNYKKIMQDNFSQIEEKEEEESPPQKHSKQGQDRRQAFNQYCTQNEQQNTFNFDLSQQQQQHKKSNKENYQNGQNYSAIQNNNNNRVQLCKEEEDYEEEEEVDEYIEGDPASRIFKNFYNNNKGNSNHIRSTETKFSAYFNQPDIQFKDNEENIKQQKNIMDLPYSEKDSIIINDDEVEEDINKILEKIPIVQQQTG